MLSEEGGSSMDATGARQSPAIGPRRLPVSCLVALAVVFASAAALAVAHVSDLFEMDHVSGVWLGLAGYFNEGVFYPPLEAEGYYGGTRYMPVLFCLHGLLAKVTGEYLISGKLLSALTLLSLLAAIGAAVRQRTGSRSLAIALATLMLAFSSGLLAFLRLRGDALPAALSVGGLLLIEKTRHGRLHLAAAALFTAAFMTKFSAIAGCAAAVLFLNRRGRGTRLAVHVGFLSLLALTVVQCLSGGRFLANLWNTGSGGTDLQSVAGAPVRFLGCLVSDPGLLALFPLALVTSIRNSRRRRLGLWDLNFAFTSVILLCILASPGTSNNHLIELQAACLVLVAENLVGRQDALRSGQRWTPWHATVGGMVCVLLAGCCFHIAGWKASWDGRDYTLETVTAAVPADARVLSEDPGVPVLLGKQPVVLDPFSFRVLAERGLIDDKSLCERLANQEFELVVLLDRIDLPEPCLGGGLHFSPGVREAIQNSYHFDRQVGRYAFFVPNADRGPVLRRSGGIVPDRMGMGKEQARRRVREVREDRSLVRRAATNHLPGRASSRQADVDAEKHAGLTPRRSPGYAFCCRSPNGSL